MKKKATTKRSLDNETRFFSLAEVSKHFGMPDIEIGVHVNTRNSQSIAETLRSVVAATVSRKTDGHRRAKQHAQ